MRFLLEIICDNDAFTDESEVPVASTVPAPSTATCTEVARILSAVAENLDCMSVDVSHIVRDMNGNSVGRTVFRDP